jgi:hypothetical protein
MMVGAVREPPAMIAMHGDDAAMPMIHRRRRRIGAAVNAPRRGRYVYRPYTRRIIVTSPY